MMMQIVSVLQKSLRKKAWMVYLFHMQTSVQSTNVRALQRS